MDQNFRHAEEDVERHEKALRTSMMTKGNIFNVSGTIKGLKLELSGNV